VGGDGGGDTGETGGGRQCGREMVAVTQGETGTTAHHHQ
jgi:hypothetical protein